MDYALLIEVGAKWGIGGIALILLYYLAHTERKENREERKENRIEREAQNELWRKSIEKTSDKTDIVIKELTDVIRNINDK